MAHHLFHESFAALMYDEEEDYGHAIRVLREHLAANPANAAAYNNRGVAYSEIGQPERALADFAEAARLAPSDPLPAKSRGILLHAPGDLPAALAALDAAVRVAPND